MQGTKRPRAAGVENEATAHHAAGAAETAAVSSSASMDAYIAGADPRARGVLDAIRGIVRRVAPEAEEIISYRMPAFRLRGVLVYFAAFKDHIGVYPPLRGDEALEAALGPYMGPKGNLKFPYSKPVPLDLIERYVRLRLAQTSGKRLTRTRPKRA